MNTVHIYVYLLLNLPSLIITTPCEIPDRQYKCDSILQSNNRTVVFENADNASSNNFLSAIHSLKYCNGSFFCRTKTRPNAIPPINIGTHLLCFSDISCLLGGGVEHPCTCMHLKDLHEYNITSDALTGIYTCIKVGKESLEAPLCLKAACKGFAAIEKFCMCPNHSWNCTCHSYCEDLSPSQGTYALFFSFGDIYVISGAKNYHLHWLVVFVLFIGLTFLLFTFCKLCESIQDTRRAPSSKSPSVEEHQIGRIPPPPSYEQVMKDKCIEFKKSVVKPDSRVTV